LFFFVNLKRENLVSVLAHADVVLDTLPFSDRNNVLAAMSLGVPVVSWPQTVCILICVKASH
jgi:predicted O-linked N-acetylglucosamine transferase (SPINDLY family)